MQTFPGLGWDITNWMIGVSLGFMEEHAMKKDVQDLFPTRLERKLGMFERIDPVVFTEGAERNDGPLSEEQVREYEKKGFLSFESFFDREEMEAFIQELREYEQD